jgi:hypothetical protein
MRPATRRRTPLLLSLVAALLLLAVAACASGGGDSDAADSGGDAGFNASAGDAPAEAPADRDANERGAVDDYAEMDGSLAHLSANVDAVQNNAVDRKIIAKGNVSLEAENVGNTAFHVTRIADEYGGEVTERETTTNDDGDISTARLLLRIPVADFDQAFTELEDVADLQSSNTGKEDVTTKVIDTQVRIRAQRRSLLRVEALLDRAQSISDIIRIESQLTRRQADLESLESRLTYLTDQTSMSTISVNISLPPKEKKEEKKKEEPEEAGFLAGLEDGWKALKSFGTDVATLAGQLLPFTAVLLLIGGPVFLLVRRLRRRDGDVPDVPTPADA